MMTKDQRHEVRETRDKILEFDGWLLGSSSSEAPGKSRWAEVAIHKTLGGKWIVSGVGRTIVPGEEDRFWANVCDDPRKVVDSLYLAATIKDPVTGRRMPDPTGRREIPNVNRAALEEACDADPALSDAFAFEVEFIE